MRLLTEWHGEGVRQAPVAQARWSLQAVISSRHLSTVYLKRLVI